MNQAVAVDHAEARVVVHPGRAHLVIAAAVAAGQTDEVDQLAVLAARAAQGRDLAQLNLIRVYFGEQAAAALAASGRAGVSATAMVATVKVMFDMASPKAVGTDVMLSPYEQAAAGGPDA